MEYVIVRLRDRYSEESIAQLPPRIRLLVLNAEAEVDLDDPTAIGKDLLRVDFHARKNAAWVELEKLAGV
jgi:hypothetical protein